MKKIGEVPGAQKVRDMIGHMQEASVEISHMRSCTLMWFEIFSREYRVAKDENERRRIEKAVEQLLSCARDDLDERLRELLGLTS